MACNHPFNAYWTGNYTENGKKEYILNCIPGDEFLDIALSKVKINPNAPMVSIDGHTFLTERIPIPCGHCIGCRMTKAKNWAVRLALEAKSYPNRTWFVTLTYEDHQIPKDLTLVKDHFRSFMKNMRGHLKSDHKDFRYFMCFEYGETTLRPHMHVILFGDLELGEQLAPNVWHSPQIVAAWPYGLHEVSHADYGAFHYVAGYVLKKQEMIDKYQFKQPPFIRMSDRPIIGYKDCCELHGRKDYRVYGVFGDGVYSAPIPKAFLKKHSEEDWYTDYRETIVDLQDQNIYINLAQFGEISVEGVGTKKDKILLDNLKRKEERRLKRI